MTILKLFIKLLIWLGVSITSGALMATMGIYLYLSPSLPSPYELRNVDLQIPLRIYSADNKLMAEFGEKRRSPIMYNQTPPEFIQALLAAEDDAFFEHHGVDIKGLVRASIQLLTTGKKKSGGSTITMQVARNYYLSREKTFLRKFTEILLALKIERFLTKEEILSLYVNKVYLGERAYGIEAAANVYYGRSVGELSLAQLAMIAGLPQAPSAANPLTNPSRAKLRRNYVLKRMLDIGHISVDEYLESSDAPISASRQGSNKEIEAGYAAEMVRLELIKRFGDSAYTRGLKVITTINSERQNAANLALQRGLLSYDRDHGWRKDSNKTIWDKVTTEQRAEKSLEEYQKELSQQFEELTLNPEFVNLIYQDTKTDWPATLNDWKQKLAKRISLGVISPAIVAAINEEGVWTWSTKGVQWLSFENIKWAKTYLTVNSVGDEPTSPEQVLQQGQLIWLETLADEQIKLAQKPEVQGALISLRPNDGAVQAVVGGFHHADNEFNRVTQSDRQPGSAFKPFVYSAGLNKGLTPATLINDAPVVFEDKRLEYTWRPENVSGKFYGPTRLRRALFRSQNLVSIRILQQVGPKTAASFIAPFGFNKNKLNKDLSLALGSSAVSPLELAQGYAAFANGGYRVEPYLINEIYDNNNLLIYKANPALACRSCQKNSKKTETSENIALENALVSLGLEPNQAQPPRAKRVISKQVNFLMLTMLRDVVVRGTGTRALVLNRKDIVGKTGTTNDQKDGWFSGIASELATTVWVGFDQPETLGRWAYGSNTALPIWVDYMKEALKGVEDKRLTQPSGIVSVRIDPESGLLAHPEQTDAIFEYFRQENVPTEYAIPKVSLEEGSDSIDQKIKEITPEQLF